MVEERRIEREMDDFTYTLIPFGSADIRALVITAINAGKDGRWCAEQITEYMDQCEAKLGEIDPNYVICDALLQEARNDIDQLTGIDILNDLSEEVNVSGNFMCTSLDYTEEAKEETLNVIKEIDEEDRTDAINWLISELE